MSHEFLLSRYLNEFTPRESNVLAFQIEYLSRLYYPYWKHCLLSLLSPFFELLLEETLGNHKSLQLKNEPRGFISNTFKTNK